MRCLVCLGFSWELICKKCQERLLRPSVRLRHLDGLDVYSFYSYGEIKELLLSKYSFIGSAIFKILAKNSLRIFANEFQAKASVIGIDDKINSFGYSHTAILAKSMTTSFLKPRFNALIAQNSVRYAGKSLEFRKKNPRNFHYTAGAEDIILVDDIVTTGTTLLEAKECCTKAGASVLFALVLADAKDYL